MKTMLKDALVLFVITLIAGISLGAVNLVTKEPIRQAGERARNEAFSLVFPGAASYEEEDKAALKQLEEPDYALVHMDGVYKSLDGAGEVLGYVLLVTTKEGYGGDISFAMGITKEGILNGISILSISETAGLGMRAPEVLVPQFAGKKARHFTVTKGDASGEDKIDAISGATITSKAVTNAVNAGIAYFETVLGGSTDGE